MAILRSGTTAYNSTSVVGDDIYTVSGFDPGYPGTEKGRIVIISCQSGQTQPGNSTIAGITYGGVPMRFMVGDSNLQQAANEFMAFIINPPTGAQDIVFQNVNSLGFAIRYIIIPYYSDSDYSFRIGNKIYQNATGNSALITTTYANSWSVGFTIRATVQTLTTGTYVNGSGNPGIFMMADSNGEVADGVSTGIAVSGANAVQAAATFMPIRRGIFQFLLDLQ